MDQDRWGYLKTRSNFVPQEWVVELAVRLSICVPGHIVEFGVFRGSSLCAIRDALERYNCLRVGDRKFDLGKKVYGFDSFRGLSEKFEALKPGHFACTPPVIPGTRIIEGFFEESLTPDLAQRIGKVSLAHLDADLYSSTLCALRWLTPMIHCGSLLLFDEFRGEQESEKRAFETWREESGVRTLKIAEFGRRPSGLGGTSGDESAPDQRVLYQVIDEKGLSIPW